MALNKQIWINQIMQGFYPDDSFLSKADNLTAFVEYNTIHIAGAGIDPKVLINNTTYPIRVLQREDSDNAISLDKFETENTLVRRPDVIEYSFDKVESVIMQHRATLRKAVSMKAIHAYAPTSDTSDTPVILTTGEVKNGRKVLTCADILALKERFDDADIPADDRYLVLHPKHATDLLTEDLKLFKNITDLQNGEPFRFAGFGIFTFSKMPTYSLIDNVLTKIAFDGEASNQFASIAFYAKEVMKADGDIFMYVRENDPEERGTIMGFDKRFIAMPKRNKGIGAIVTDLA